MKTKRLNGKVLLAGMFLAALIFRLYLSDKAWHVDMLSNASWGEQIYEYGTKTFYNNNVWSYSWPTQPPLVNSIYGFNRKMHIELLGRMAWIEFQLNKILPGDKVYWLTNFVDWFGYGRVDLENPYQIGFLTTMKLLPIISDLGIAWLILQITKKRLYTLIYLVSPFSWYVSSLWGQYDSVGTLFALASFWSLEKKFKVISPLMLMTAILIKPTALILIPFYLYLFWKRFRGKWFEIGISLVLPVVMFWTTTTPYTHKNPFEFARYDLIRIVFEKAEPRVSVNAFNMWRIFIGDKAVNSTDVLLVLPWKDFGNILVVLINLAAIWYFEKNKAKSDSVWTGLFIAAGGTWLVMTGMLERYFYVGIVAGLIMSAFNPKILKYWILVSATFWINLFYHWWIPAEFSYLKQALLWNNGIVTNWLSVLMVLLFAKIIYVQSRPT